MKLLAAAALVAGLAISSAAGAANLLTNGSFEADGGTFAGWTRTGATGDNNPAVVIAYGQSAGYPIGAYGEAVGPDNSVSASPDAVGTHGAYFVSDLTVETLYQDIFLAAGDYNIGFSLYAPQNGLNNPIDAWFSGTIAGQTLHGDYVSQLTPTTWTNFSGTVHIDTADTYRAEFLFMTDGRPAKDVLVDRVYVTTAGVPEPASWALMILGVGAAGAMVRTQRRRQGVFA